MSDSPQPIHVLLNWGANDMATTLPAQATWQNYYLTIIDAVHAKWPQAKVWIMYPWRQSQDANATTLHGWIDNVIAARSSFTFAGPDEAVWMKGADNGATQTVDGVHYSTTGNTTAANQWKAAFGY